MTPTKRYCTKEEIIKKGLAIDTGLCTMCGLCPAVCPTGAIKLDQSKTEPRLTFGEGCNDCGICYKACGGGDIPLKELDKFVFGRERDFNKEVLGITRAIYQANACDPEIRASGACGGVATALMVYALEKKLISAATVVGFDKQHPWKAIPVLATSRKEIIGAANSKYVIVPTNASLAELVEKKITGQVGCVGLACHVHSLRKLQYRVPKHRLSKRIQFIVGVHCGYNMRMGQREILLKNNFGLSLDGIKGLNYRKGKVPGSHAEVVMTSGEVRRTTGKYWPGDTLLSAGRCNICWDWGAELSDVSVCDLFGPPASNSDVHLGASTLIVRTQTGEQLVKDAVEAGYLKIYPTPVEPLLRSYGLNLKKFAAASALMALKKMGLPYPDYQYEIEPTPPIDRTSQASGVPWEEREKFWAQRGIHTLE